MVPAPPELGGQLDRVDPACSRLVTDIRMPPTGTDEGIRAAERLRQQHPIWSEPVPGIPATLKALVTDDELPVAGRLLEKRRASTGR